MRLAVAAATAFLLATPAAIARETAVGVGLREFRLALYREAVRPGTVKFNLTNYGEDAHDFVIRTRRGRIVARSPEVPANGGRITLRVRLPHAQRFIVFCSIADHEQRGMRARLLVSRRAPR